MLILVIASSVLGLYALIHVPRLTPRAGLDAVTTIGVVADTITVFYLFFFAMLVMLAVFLMQDGRLPVISMREPFFLLIYLGLLAVGVLGIKISNLDSIRADIFYKQGLNFDNNQQWDGSIAMYRACRCRQSSSIRRDRMPSPASGAPRPACGGCGAAATSAT